MNRAHSFSRSEEFTGVEPRVAAEASAEGQHWNGSPPSSITVSELMQLGFIGPLCLAAETVEQALQSAAHFSPLWSSCRFRYEACGLDAAVCADPRERPGASPSFDATEAVLLLVRLATAVAVRRIAPLSVTAPRHCASALARTVGCALELADDRVAVRFHESDLKLANRAADPRLYRVLAEHAEHRLRDLQRDQTTCTGVRRALERLASRGDLSAERVGRELGLGVRTLHRRLRAEGTSFRTLLMEFQLERSLRELESSSVTAKQVAFALGFADPASFHRAFKRWTGQTISEYRRAGSAAPRPERGARR